jgi:hypothetical protein
MRKIQVPSVGGIRKMVTLPQQDLATTIGGFAGQTLSVAQLKTLLGVVTPPPGNGNIGPPGQGTPPPAPGSNAPHPIFMFNDEGGGDDGGGPPGQQGTNGAAGIQGPIGATGPAGTSLVFANTTVPVGNTVANTSSETFFTSSYNIPANSLTAGTVLRVRLFGVYSTGIVAPSLTLKIYFGPTVMVASGTLTTVANITNDGWSAEGLFIVQTTGVSGTIEAQGLSEFSTASTAVLFVNMDNAAPITVDTTIAEVLRASVQWGGTVNASDTITLREMTVEMMATIGVPGAMASPTSIPVFFGDDGEDGIMGPPGPAGTGGGGAAAATGARVKLTSNFAISNSAQTTVQWGSAVFDTSGFFNGANPTRLTAQATGLHIVSAALYWGVSSAGERLFSFIVNGNTGNRIALASDQPTAADTSIVSSVLLNLTLGDYVEVYAFQNTGGSLNVISGEELSTFSIAKI